MSELLPAVKPSAMATMSSRLNVEPAKLLATLKSTVFKGASDEELLALVVVANEYDLNPILKEMYAFPAKGGGIVPLVSIDGWIKIVNRQENYDGMEFRWDVATDGKPIACECIMRLKNRSHPVIVKEYLDECSRNSEPWAKMPKRMLRHKAFMQCARLAFGLSGIYDDDEARDISGVTVAASRPVVIASPAGLPQVADDNPELGPSAPPAASPEPVKRKPGRPPKDRNLELLPAVDVPAESPAATVTVTAPAIVVEPPKPKAETAPTAAVDPKAAIAEFLTEHKIEFGDLCSYLEIKGIDRNATSYPSFEELSPATASALLQMPKELSKIVQLYGQSAQ